MRFSSFSNLVNQLSSHAAGQLSEFSSFFKKPEEQRLVANPHHPELPTLPEGFAVQKTSEGLGRHKKPLMIFASSVLVGLLAALAVGQIAGWRKAKVKVLVAKQDVASWTALREPANLFSIEDRKESEVPEDHVASLEELADRILIRDLQPGQVLCRSALMASNKAGVEGQLKEGMRAVAVDTDAAMVAGGFVHPDSYVDVIHTHLDEHQEPVSTVVLQDVHVLAQDQSTRTPGDKPGSVPATVTLELDPFQAMELAKAKEGGGSIVLLLRPFGDHEIRHQQPLYSKSKDGRILEFGDYQVIRQRGKGPRLDTKVYDPEDVAPDPDVVAGLKSPPSPGQRVSPTRLKN
ncbi:MAG TPA: Flp pilus assembly protein CpaB [Gemmataceae bacterium]|jgi:Flp pilus assembly protein CpaB|nr:Flp pilus assembly protein CpaB [Gemmataceae bacterium]